MMELNTFNELQNELDSPIESSPITKLQKIKEKLEQATKDGSLQIVDLDEIKLVAKYRVWKASSDSVSGIFHYKK